MGILNLSINTRRPDATLKMRFEQTTNKSNPEVLNRLLNFITGINAGNELGPVGGAPSIAVSIDGQQTAASGTLTVSATGSSATQTCSIAGVTFTAVASGATGNQFVVSATPATQAANMAAAINASSSLTGIVTATSAAGVVTITSAVKGVIGNGLAISAGTLSNVAASGALLTGGAADPTAITYTF
jgi:hypothetical protein